jgi:aspartyl-tRNA(Asn)/glutamyl-tRNA(Gln) amidotransferase subunit A
MVSSVEQRGKSSDLAFATIQELSPLLAKKKLSPVELVESYLARIERLNQRFNAFITVTAEQALADARVAERELARGKRRGPLHGIPIALKDNIWTKGIRTTMGSAILRDFVPVADATLVRKLRKAGAVILGKTNLHEFAYGATNENPHFGPTHSPWAHERITGGSSGGSAAAVCAGLCVAAIGSDTGGSIRVPAALCGIVGLKPTFGRVSVHGVFPLAPSLDHIGPLARSVADAALVLGAIAGRDPLDPTSVAKPAENFLPAAKAKRRKIRLGWPKEHLWERIHPDVQRLVEAAASSLVRNGGSIEEVSLPTLSAAVEAANMMSIAEALAVHEQAGYFPARASEYGEDVRKRLGMGSDIRAVEYLKGRATLERAKAEFAAAFESVDAIVAPTVPMVAPKIGSETVRIGSTDEPMRSALLRLTRPGNLTGLPNVSTPCGFTSEGLPVGMQLIGRPFGEGDLLEIAQIYERENDWVSRHPASAA